MAWLANEFFKERKWKALQAKKWAKVVSRSQLDVESRAVRRAKEEEASLKSRASWIAREVMYFWGKVQRICVYKAQAVQEVRTRRNSHACFI